MLKTMYITNSPEVALIAENAGVDRIWIDLEIVNKEERQKGRNTVISAHSIEDVSKVKEVLTKSQLLVRVNPINENSKAEIDAVIKNGADVVMLPMYETVEEVRKFLEYVNGRAVTVLLLETIGAEKCLDEVLKIPQVDEIHIGLNDLHIQYKNKFMFELLSNGKVEEICRKIAKTSKPYGFGGIAQLNEGNLPAKYIIAEHHRLGSTRAILSRSFTNYNIMLDRKNASEEFENSLREIKEYEKSLATKSAEFFEENHKILSDIVNKIVG